MEDGEDSASSGEAGRGVAAQRTAAAGALLSERPAVSTRQMDRNKTAEWR